MTCIVGNRPGARGTTERRCRAGVFEKSQQPSVGIRRVRPTDGPALLEMHQRCSLTTRYNRWLALSAVFPKAYLRSLLAGDCEHIAVVAVAHGRPGVVGLASAALTSDGRRELGLLVEDRYQGHGIGMLMLDTLVELCDGDEDLCASMRFENEWLLAKLERFGTVLTQHDQGVVYARVSRSGDVR